MINTDRWELRERPLLFPLSSSSARGIEGEVVRLTSTYAMPAPSKKPEPTSENAPQGFSDAPASEAQQAMVLVAEDEETIAETLALLVEDAGCIPIVAHDGREALALARQHHPHLIITDLMMPYMTGAELIAAVRADADAQGYAPPAIMVVTAASRAHAQQAGADAVVGKPFDITQVESVMQRLLGERSS